MPIADRRSADSHVNEPWRHRRRGTATDSPRTPRLLALVLAATTCCPVAAYGQQRPQVHAGEQAQCRYIEEQARAEASTLQAPELVVQVLRFPDAYGLEGTTWGQGFQGRLGLAYSPTDLLKGFEVENLGAARCRAHRSETRAISGLDGVWNRIRHGALQARLEFLEQRRAAWLSIQQRAELRLSEQLITRSEAVDVRRRVQALEEQVLEAEARLAELDATAADGSAAAASPALLVQEHVEAELLAERAQSNVRKLTAWQFRLTGGVIPTPREVNWYSVAEFRLNLGAPQLYHHLERAEDARKQALRESVRELPARLTRLRAEARAIDQQSKKRLALLERQLSHIDADVSALERAQNETGKQLRDALELERIAAEAERVSLQRLITGLMPLVREEGHRD